MARHWRSTVVVAVLLLPSLACDNQRSPTPTGPSIDIRTSPSPPVSPPGFLPAPQPAPTSADSLVGRYVLDVALSPSSCEVPAAGQRRSYTADIHEHDGSYAVKLYDAAFLADGRTLSFGCRDRRLPYDGACHMFLMRREGGSVVSVTMGAEDEWRGSEVWEALADGYLLQIGAEATGSVRDGRIELAGPGGLWWGNGLPATQSRSCKGDVRLTFTRR